jgi:hypothetical protein
MAKLTRKLQKIFCGNVSSASVIAQFGSLKAASPIYSDDIDTLTLLPAWTNGWADAVLTDNAPTIQDMNGLFYVMTKQLAYLMQAGISEWNATTTYYIGSLVSDGLGNIYRSYIDANINQSLTDRTKWTIYSSNNSKVVSSYPYQILADDFILIYGGGVMDYVLPTTSDATLRGFRFCIAPGSTGAPVAYDFMITGKTGTLGNSGTTGATGTLIALGIAAL